MNHGERRLQDRLGTRERADAFEARQTLDHLNETMRHFIGRQEMMFLATADASGDCDSTFRAGPPGFVRVLDAEHVSWPEYRGNGVLASLGNITENPQVGLLFIDFHDVIGLHVNGTAEIVEDPDDRPGTPPGQRTRLRVVARVRQAYIHCAKHIPRMERMPRGRAGGGPGSGSRVPVAAGRMPRPEGQVPRSEAQVPRSEAQIKKSDYFVPAPPLLPAVSQPR
ncbi:pyridoxamine 5'-phosphate oxidase family protein [Actinoplanes sp. DH11]|uniref:pyridoxamine 5'-phosphate oxidase family protein n=1 Tax=Actinoplanes sp. DH11 TaxID=2857011 RepID=UPI001E2D5661|nr:pyridoxamine 5'-phosphate oxidase family protein [Actinoplanes sp. DH11]